MSQQTEIAPIAGSVPSVEERAAGAGGIAWGRVIVWGLIAGLLGLVTFQLINSTASTISQGIAPDFSVTTFDGQEIRLADLRGNVVVVNFWASWCIPCADEAPELEAAWQQYKDQNVVFLGIDYLDTERKGLEFIDKWGVTYPNAPDLRQKISEAFVITGVPETFIIDAQGNITNHSPVPITRDFLSREIEKAMLASAADDA